MIAPGIDGGTAGTPRPRRAGTLGYTAAPAPPAARERGAGDWMKTIAEHLRAARARAGLTQKQAAARAGLNPMQISHWERGVKAPTLASAANLAAAYRCSLDELLGRPVTRRRRRGDCRMGDAR